VAEIRAGAGTQFDPNLTERFVQCVSSGSPCSGTSSAGLSREAPLGTDPDNPPPIRGLTGILKARGLIATG
jgi:hypothetical protein